MSYKKLYPYARRLSVALFHETNVGRTDASPIYTLAAEDFTEDGITYISIRKRYLELRDPSESAIAEIYFLDHRHWDDLCETRLLTPYIEEWRVALARMIQETAIKKIQTLAEEGNFAASKWLAEKQWNNSLEGRDNLGKKVTRSKVIKSKAKDENFEDIARISGLIRPREEKLQ